MGLINFAQADDDDDEPPPLEDIIMLLDDDDDDGHAYVPRRVLQGTWVTHFFSMDITPVAASKAKAKSQASATSGVKSRSDASDGEERPSSPSKKVHYKYVFSYIDGAGPVVTRVVR